MASLFKRPRSPYWQIRFRGSDGAWISKATAYRIGVGTETAAARRECAKRSFDERLTPADSAGRWLWVPDFLAGHYQNTASRKRAEAAWKHLADFIAANKLQTPGAIRYEHASGFLAMRKGEGAAHNTAIVEIKLLATILQEAVRRGVIAGNPWTRLGLKRERGKEKPEITAEQRATVEAALVRMPAWMIESWRIALAQGCRIREVAVPMTDIDETRMVIYFRETKGGRPYATRLHPAIVDLVQIKRSTGARLLCDLPVSAAKLWHQFLRRLGMPFSFHSTRVTVITELARAGVSATKAMRFVGHSTELVHRIYQRLQPDDLRDATAAVSGVSGSGGKRSSKNPGSRRASPARAAES